MSFVSFVREAAERAGWPNVVEVSEKLVALPFDSDEGTVNVFIRPCGTVDEKTVLEFSTIGIPLPAEASEMRYVMMEFVLRRNADLMHGHWSLEGEDSKQKLTPMATQIAETMDPPEFRSSVRVVMQEHAKLAGAIRKLNKSNVDF